MSRSEISQLLLVGSKKWNKEESKQKTKTKDQVKNELVRALEEILV